MSNYHKQDLENKIQKNKEWKRNLAARTQKLHIINELNDYIKKDTLEYTDTILLCIKLLENHNPNKPIDEKEIKNLVNEFFKNE